MNIIPIIKEISEASGLTFYHGPKDYQNVQDQKEGTIFPVCYLHLPVRATGKRVQQGLTSREYFVELFFGDQTALDYETAEHLVIISAMEDKAHKFLNTLLHHEGVKDVTSYTMYEAINLFDANLSGVILEVNVKTYDLRPICP